MKSTINQQAETIFHALDSFERIIKRDKTLLPRVAFNDLFSYVNDPDFITPAHLKDALQNDFKLRRDLKRLISKQPIATMMRAAAASSGQIEQREGDGFSIRLQLSKADPDQTYLIIASHDRDDSPHFLFVEEQNGPLYRLVIEDFYDAEAHILLSSQDEIVKALRKPKVDVILR